MFTVIPYESHEKVSEYNQGIREISSYYECNIVDLENYEELRNRKESDYLGVSVHPNEKGMSFIASVFIDSLEKVYLNKKKN